MSEDTLNYVFLPDQNKFHFCCICLSSSRVVKLWKESLSKVNQKAADALADPSQYSNLFPGLQQAVLAEQYLKETHVRVRPAAEYPLVTVSQRVSTTVF